MVRVLGCVWHRVCPPCVVPRLVARADRRLIPCAAVVRVRQGESLRPPPTWGIRCRATCACCGTVGLAAGGAVLPRCQLCRVGHAASHTIAASVVTVPYVLPVTCLAAANTSGDNRKNTLWVGNLDRRVTECVAVA